MSGTTVGLLGIALLFILMVFRTPVAFAMLLAGFFGMWVLEGFRTAGALILTESYGAVASETLIVVPMFVLLGNIAVRFKGQTLKWDSENLKITNIEEANQWTTRKYREGWEIKATA